MTGVPTDEAIQRLKTVITEALGKAEQRPVHRLASIKQPFTFRVRDFDEAVEAEAHLIGDPLRPEGP